MIGFVCSLLEPLSRAIDRLLAFADSFDRISSEIVRVVCHYLLLSHTSPFAHQFDGNEGRHDFRRDDNADKHHEAVQLLIDQIESKHAVNEGPREEDQTEQNSDGQDTHVEALQLGGKSRLEVDGVRDGGLQLTAILQD